jgi:hypothetical protein
MGRVVGQAARDDVLIDDSQVLMRVLVDAPEFHVLGRIAAVDGDQDAVRNVGDDAPAPVLSALISHGLVVPGTVLDGGQVVIGVTPFGRSLLDFLEGRSVSR